MRHAGHALRHSGLHKFLVEGTVGVLKTSGAVEQRMCIRIGFHGLVKGLEHQRVIIAFTQYIGHNAPVEEIQNCTQVELVHFYPVPELFSIPQSVFLADIRRLPFPDR